MIREAEDDSFQKMTEKLDFQKENQAQIFVFENEPILHNIKKMQKYIEKQFLGCTSWRL